MMDCKKALTEANGDFEAAIDILRKKGQKVAGNRADREANEGVVLAKVTTDAKRGVLVALNCETDFVAKNQEFIDFTTTVCDIAVNQGTANLEALLATSLDGLSIQDRITDLIGKIGEKMELQYLQVNGEYVVAYNHPGNRLATIVAFNKANATDIQTIAKDVAMQAAAMAPVALDKDDVDTRTLERELEIAREQIRAEGKPEDMVGKLLKANSINSTRIVRSSIRNSLKTINLRFVSIFSRPIRNSWQQPLSESPSETKFEKRVIWLSFFLPCFA